MALIPQLVLANNIYFKNISSARNIKTEIDYLKKNNTYMIDKYNICDKERNNLFEQKNLCLSEVTYLKEDKKGLLDVTEQCRTQIINTNKELEKVKDTIPSRLTWFVTGFGVGLLAILGSAFALK